MNLFDLIFPKSCFECGMGDRYICSRCLRKVNPAKYFCPVCNKSSTDGKTHFKCISTYSLDGLTSIYKFEGVIRKAILELKYRFVEDCASEIAEVVAKNLPDRIRKGSKTVLVPIPLHITRKRWRGFNQAESVGRYLAKDARWIFVADVLERVVNTKPQVGLAGNARKSNIKGVFKINPKYNCQNANIILFDDVWTTGSTMKEACRVLKTKGAKTVWGISIAS